MLYKSDHNYMPLGCNRCMGCAQGLETEKSFERGCSLTEGHQIGNRRIFHDDGKKKNKTVYATTQPLGEAPPPASMGVEGSDSGSGALEVRVKSEVKKSIVVYVVRESKDAMKLCDAEKLVHAHLLYIVSMS